MRRVFVAVNINQEIKEKFASLRGRFSEIPAKWTREENIHITISFLGSVSENNLIKIREALKETEGLYSFPVKINKIVYSPLISGTPKMIWAIIKESKEISSLKKEIDGIIRFKEREFFPHITLARINVWEFKKLEMEEIPKLEEPLSLSFQVESVELMESLLKKGVTEYKVIESFKLKSR